MRGRTNDQTEYVTSFASPDIIVEASLSEVRNIFQYLLSDNRQRDREEIMDYEAFTMKNKGKIRPYPKDGAWRSRDGPQSMKRDGHSTRVITNKAFN